MSGAASFLGSSLFGVDSGGFYKWRMEALALWQDSLER
jgi:hypothetical protein